MTTVDWRVWEEGLNIETNTNNSDLYETDTPTETDLKHSTDSTHPPSNSVNPL